MPKNGTTSEPDNFNDERDVKLFIYKSSLSYCAQFVTILDFDVSEPAVVYSLQASN